LFNSDSKQIKAIYFYNTKNLFEIDTNSFTNLYQQIATKSNKLLSFHTAKDDDKINDNKSSVYKIYNTLKNNKSCYLKIKSREFTKLYTNIGELELFTCEYFNNAKFNCLYCTPKILQHLLKQHIKRCINDHVFIFIITGNNITICSYIEF